MFSGIYFNFCYSERCTFLDLDWNNIKNSKTKNRRFRQMKQNEKSDRERETIQRTLDLPFFAHLYRLNFQVSAIKSETWRLQKKFSCDAFWKFWLQNVSIVNVCMRSYLLWLTTKIIFIVYERLVPVRNTLNSFPTGIMRTFSELINWFMPISFVGCYYFKENSTQIWWRTIGKSEFSIAIHIWSQILSNKRWDIVLQYAIKFY